MKSSARRRSALGVIVIITGQDAVRIAMGVIELALFQRPEEGHKANPPQKQRYRNQNCQDCHVYFSLSAFRVTEIDDSDMAKAAASGVAAPTKASGTATTL